MTYHDLEHLSPPFPRLGEEVAIYLETEAQEGLLLYEKDGEVLQKPMARVPGGLKAQVAVAQSPFRYLFRLPEGYWGSHGLEKALPRYDRFFHLFAHPLPPEWALGTVYALLFAFPGSPAIYYGDEIGPSQPNPYEVWAGDPHCRAPFPWDEGSWDRDLLRFLKRLVHLKKTHPAQTS
jgi:glycosidase